jgi:hypothetical protein
MKIFSETTENNDDDGQEPWPRLLVQALIATLTQVLDHQSSGPNGCVKTDYIAEGKSYYASM